MATKAQPSFSNSKDIPTPGSARAVVAPPKRLTVETWAALPDTHPRYELIDGVLKQKRKTRRSQAYAVNRLTWFLMLWGLKQGWRFYWEDRAFKVNEQNGFVPDAIGFAPSTVLNPSAFYEDSAFLVIEVSLPSTARKAQNVKMQGYACAKVEIYILVNDKSKTLEVYRLEGAHYIAPEVLEDNATWQPAEFSGFTLELAKLWM